MPNNKDKNLWKIIAMYKIKNVWNKNSIIKLFVNYSDKLFFIALNNRDVKLDSNK